MPGQAPDRVTVAAFMGVVFAGGLNAVAIKFSNAELDPFWGAALRFGLAALILFAVVAGRRIALPRGATLTSSILYGVLGFGVPYALAYWSLLEVPAGTAMIILALVPLLTLVLAVVQGLERFSWQSAFGSLVALAGIAAVFWDHVGASTASVLPIAGVLLGALSIAETNVVVKRYPRANPIANNALAMAVGSALLLVVAMLAGNSFTVPQAPATIAAVAFLVLVGSVALFMLFLFVIERWTASATSYTLLLMPLVTVAGAAALLGEPVTAGMVVGGALVLLGTYVGAFAPSISVPLPGLVRRPRAVAAPPEAPPELPSPCP